MFYIIQTTHFTSAKHCGKYSLLGSVYSTFKYQWDLQWLSVWDTMIFQCAQHWFDSAIYNDSDIFNTDLECTLQWFQMQPIMIHNDFKCSSSLLVKFQIKWNIYVTQYMWYRAGRAWLEQCDAKNVERWPFNTSFMSHSAEALSNKLR